MKRNIEGRIVKLETARHRVNEMLLLWKRPEESSRKVYDAARDLFAPHDKVMIATWFGEEPAPAPRWHCDFPKSLCHIENDYLDRWMDECILTLNEQLTAFGEPAGVDDQYDGKPVYEYTNGELWYELLRADRMLMIESPPSGAA